MMSSAEGIAMSDWSSADTATAVLRYLTEHADENGEVAVSHPYLGEALNIGRSTAARALRRLHAEGRVAIAKVGTGDGYPSRYRLVALAEQGVAA